MGERLQAARRGEFGIMKVWLVHRHCYECGGSADKIFYSEEKAEAYCALMNSRRVDDPDDEYCCYGMDVE